MKFHFIYYSPPVTTLPYRSDAAISINNTESQLECNDGLNNPKVIREYRTSPTLLSPKNIRVKALLTFGMEPPTSIPQEKEESFNEAKKNNGDMEDKSASQTRRREILSPKAQRLSKATVSAVKSLLPVNRICA